NRYRVEQWALSNLKRLRGRTLLARLREESAAASANDLRREAARAGVDACPSADGYDALAQRIRIQQGLDKVCRELDPASLAHVPREARMGVLLTWMREHAFDASCVATLAPLSNEPWEEATRDVRPVLAGFEVHVCAMLAGLAAPTDPHA